MIHYFILPQLPQLPQSEVMINLFRSRSKDRVIALFFFEIRLYPTLYPTLTCVPHVPHFRVHCRPLRKILDVLRIIALFFFEI